MKIAEMNWLQVEEHLKHDDRAVIPLGSTEQHAYLSLSTDSILAERVAVEAVEPIGVAAFPVVGGRPGRPRTHPATLYADAGFDCEATRTILRWLGIEPHIRHKGDPHGSHRGDRGAAIVRDPGHHRARGRGKAPEKRDCPAPNGVGFTSPPVSPSPLRREGEKSPILQ